MKNITNFVTSDELGLTLSRYTSCENVYEAFTEALTKLRFQMGERIGYTVEIREDYLTLHPKLAAKRKNGSGVVVVVTPVVIKRTMFINRGTIYFKFVGKCNDNVATHLIRSVGKLIVGFVRNLFSK